MRFCVQIDWVVTDAAAVSSWTCAGCDERHDFDPPVGFAAVTGSIDEHERRCGYQGATDRNCSTTAGGGTQSDSLPAHGSSGV